MSRNSKLKEKHYINEKIHLAIENIFVLHHSLKINKWGGLVSFGGGGRCWEKITKLISVPTPPPFIRHLTVHLHNLPLKSVSTQYQII